MASRSLTILALCLVLAGCGGHPSWRDGAQTHIVRKGETLHAISFRYGKSARDLARWNRLGDGSLIYPGQVIRLTPPGGASSQSSAGQAGRRQSLPSIPSQPPPAWSWPTSGRISVEFGGKPGSGTGVLIDGDELASQSAKMAREIHALEKAAHEAAGRPFNLGSPKQLQEILFGELELPVIRKTPKGQPSTAEDVLQELAADYELPDLILRYRSLSKLKSTYTDKLPQQINPRTGRVHTSYHQAVAATGRLSSSDPNLQNIPIRTPQGRRIREAFVAPRGWRILACDYSQIELRIMAHLSGDKGLLQAFRDGIDVHRATAGEVFGTPYEAVDADQRRAAKAINFGLMYGMSAFGLSKQLAISRAEAQAYMDTYFERYPGVRDFMEDTRVSAREKGYVETLFGRRLYLPDINASNGQRRQAAERAAINAPMQGTAADIIKRAMISVDGWLQSRKPDAHLVMQVHDELVFEVREDQLDDLRAAVVRRMSEAAELDVPLVVDTGHGPDWDTAH